MGMTNSDWKEAYNIVCRDRDALKSAHGKAVDRIRELEAELSEARRDGARARWYFDRKNASKVVEIELRCIQADDWWDYQRWAQEIDTAMEAK